jgi:predicted DNA-binding protein YlxM (UPF0122 family)
MVDKPHAKSRDRIAEIMVELSANELTIPEICKEFGVSRSYVYAINKGRYARIEGFNYPVRSFIKYPKDMG